MNQSMRNIVYSLIFFGILAIAVWGAINAAKVDREIEKQRMRETIREMVKPEALKDTTKQCQN